MSTDDVDAAQYVLAYLFNNKYSRTMAEFLKECPHVQCSPDNVMILPSVPLENIIKSYKTRQSTSVLSQTLGQQVAWKSLWEKLQQTLEQLDSLAQETTWTTNIRKKQGRSKVHVRSIFPSNYLTKQNEVATSSPSMSSSQSVTNPSVSNDELLSQVQTLIPHQQYNEKSPRKKKTNPPKRKQEFQSSTAEVNEEVQQVLDMFMSSEDIQLTSLINVLPVMMRQHLINLH